MQNKNPNGPDKALPSTEQELEQYGVWVKAEPQDIVEDTETEHAILDEIDDLDIDTMDLDSSLTDDALLSVEEEQTLEDYEADSISPAATEDTAIVFDDEPVLADDFGLDDELIIEDLEKSTDQTADTSYDLVSNTEYELQAANADESLSGFEIDDLEMDMAVEPNANETDSQAEEALQSEYTLDDFGADLEADTDSADSVADAELMEELNDSDDIIDIPLDELDYEAPLAKKAELEAEASYQKDSSTQEMDLTEISLDEFGMSEESEAEATASNAGSSDSIIEDLDIDSFMGTESSNEFEEVSFDDDSGTAATEAENNEESLTETELDSNEDFLEPIDLDLQFDDTIPSPDDNRNAVGIDFNPDEVEDVSEKVSQAAQDDDFDADALLADVFDESEEKTLDFSAPEKTDISMPGSFESQGQQKPATQDFDDLAAFEKDMQTTPAPANSTGQGEASSQLLLQIASELSSIKSELMSLRSQLKDIKAGNIEAEAAAESENPFEDDEASEAAKGGFFDDEDDETIALTGDELDNILNTADFTEETLVEESILEEPDLSDQAFANLEEESFSKFETQELLPEDGIYTENAPGIETISADDSALDLTVDDEATELDDLSAELPDEIQPMTEAPEDSSYLEDEIEAYPLEDVPLEEPDLSELALDDVLVEADDELSEELPLLDDSPDPSSDEMIEELDLSDDEMSFDDDISLDIEGEDSDLATGETASASIPEIEELSEIDFEEDDESEIHLHSEEASKAAEPIIESAKTVEPVQVHPDELSMSLDDSFFVDSTGDNQVEEYIEELDDDFMPKDLTETEAPNIETAAAPEEAEVVPELGIPANPAVPDKLSHDIKSVLLYLDQLLSALPEEKIEEFASSEYYDTYKKLFDELGIL
ncbi:MAG: hypothetical protein KKI09_09210 [Spirochaetes bacterium]|nr:hypothetical protein [Spirochaetota bacterium]